MLPDRVSNPGPLPIALRGPATKPFLVTNIILDIILSCHGSHMAPTELIYTEIQGRLTYNANICPIFHFVLYFVVYKSQYNIIH